eukprot:6960977-Prymnesium_polylepis.1
MDGRCGQGVCHSVAGLLSFDLCSQQWLSTWCEFTPSPRGRPSTVAAVCKVATAPLLSHAAAAAARCGDCTSSQH